MESVWARHNVYVGRNVGFFYNALSQISGLLFVKWSEGRGVEWQTYSNGKWGKLLCNELSAGEFEDRSREPGTRSFVARSSELVGEEGGRKVCVGRVARLFCCNCQRLWSRLRQTLALIMNDVRPTLLPANCWLWPKPYQNSSDLFNFARCMQLHYFVWSSMTTNRQQQQLQ